MILQNIDEISREMNRDVLLLRFHPTDFDEYLEYEYKNDAVRTEILENLKQMEIPFKPCLGFYHPNDFGRWCGQIYLDVPYDENLPMYQRLKEYLEFPDNSMRFETVKFYILKLEQAIDHALKYPKENEDSDEDDS